MAGVPDLEEMHNIEAPTDEVELRTIIDLFGIKVRAIQARKWHFFKNVSMLNFRRFSMP